MCHLNFLSTTRHKRLKKNNYDEFDLKCVFTYLFNSCDDVTAFFLSCWEKIAIIINYPLSGCLLNRTQPLGGSKFFVFNVSDCLVRLFGLKAIMKAVAH